MIGRQITYSRSGLFSTRVFFLLVLLTIVAPRLDAQHKQQAPGDGKNEIRDEKSSFHIYPNPNSGKFTIVIKGMSAAFDINIYNLIGEMVYHWESENADNTSLEVNLSKQPRGIYLVELDTENENIIKKIVVEHEKLN